MRLTGCTCLRRGACALAVVVGVLATPPRTALAQDAQARWQALNQQVVTSYRQGQADAAIPLAEQALALAREAFDDTDERTLTSLNNLALLLQAQGRLDDAGPLLREALQGRREVLGLRHPDTLTSLNNLAVVLQDQGRLDDAEPLLREALQGRREVLGPRHHDTLASLNNLAVVLQDQGRQADAEPFLREALQGLLEALGPRHPDTLASLHNLAMVLRDQGRLDDAEPLLREALQGRREVLGPRHPDTLASLNNLALLLQDQGCYAEAEPLARELVQVSRETLGPRPLDTLRNLTTLAALLLQQGRYAEAEPLLREAAQGRRELLGPRHRDTLGSLNNMAVLLQAQGRLDDAEPLLREVLQGRREALGPRHRDTLASLDSLAALLWQQGRYGEAEPLLREALQGQREMLGPRHPDTLTSLHNLAVVLRDQGRLDDAEPLAREALQGKRETLGPRHHDTLASLNSLAVVLRAQGRYGEAEPLLRDTLQAARDPAVLGPAHPHTLTVQLNLVKLLAAEGRVAEAARLQQAMEPQVLTWLGAELFSAEAAPVRQGLVASQAAYQDIALSLALLPWAPPEATELAASAVLRFKGLATEEEAYLASVVRRGEDAHVRALAAEIAGLHARLAGLFRAGGGPDANGLAERLDRKELELGRASPAYGQALRVRNASLQDLRRALAGLPARGALLEVRQYRPADFKTVHFGEARWAGVLVTADGETRVRDLGPVTEGERAVQALLRASGSEADAAASALYQQLLAPFAAELAGVERLYVAPDGALYLAGVPTLHGPDGRRLLEAVDVRLVQTGRDLLRPPADRPARGLVALGGIAFDRAPAQAASVFPASVPGALPGVEPEHLRERAAATLRGGTGFTPLPGTKEEVERIAEEYRRARGDEPAPVVLEGAEASKARLLALAPPRVLHLATHGFYWGRERPVDRPLLLAGIALAGADQALHGGAPDGILYAIEVQDLNLDGTELVVLSACDTAKGQIDYGEGISGLVRALRTAGARNVLVTLRPVSDEGTVAFMQRFYKHWLAQGPGSDPAGALRATQQEYLAPNPAAAGTPDTAAPGSTDDTWTSFILVGG